MEAYTTSWLVPVLGAIKKARLSAYREKWREKGKIGKKVTRYVNPIQRLHDIYPSVAFLA